ncbi:hypothetical protein KR222_005283 [Zaprionus bogoriensis]|nr:hypothetical protein KR222_005283 [Zaprionus bogoriensis]
MSGEQEKTIAKSLSRFRDRKTIWYTVNEICQEGVCPSCGRSLDKFKNVTAHAKRCFSIKKIGPIYRLHGYVECQCGLLIADNTKAKKLHLCMGAVPAFEPDLSYISATAAEAAASPAQAQPQHERAPPKPWIRNFVTPIKLDIENMHENIKSEPRVRNFDIPATSKLEPHNVSVYSISSNNGAICVTGHSQKSGKRSIILISKPALRLPRLKSSRASS